MKKVGQPVDTSAIDVAELEQWIRQDITRINAVKCQALISLTKDVSVASVCAVLGTTRETLRQWRKRIAKKGVQGLDIRAGRGRKTGLSKKIQNDLKRVVLKPPIGVGYNQAIWDGKLVCKYLADKHALEIAVRTAQGWLKKIGFTRQRPRYKFNKTDEAANARFVGAIKKT
jgi:transposase